MWTLLVIYIPVDDDYWYSFAVWTGHEASNESIIVYDSPIFRNQTEQRQRSVAQSAKAKMLLDFPARAPTWSVPRSQRWDDRIVAIPRIGEDLNLKDVKN